ncbi:MAG: radical SAM protein [Spirochaetaceae bacterium]|jgi:threonylcarbamoyladenosine tRNA methylthiotransferase MtaB|nr:radical SAM protein [Spirochaetaceae bacterium]
MISVLFHTLGCKLNQLETEAISDAFRQAGCTILSGNGGQPDLCIINTCTVTSKAEQKARRIIRFYLRRNCAVIVTGCYAQLEKEQLESLSQGPLYGNSPLNGGPLFVVPGRAKDRLLDLPSFLAKEKADTVLLRGVLAHWLETKGGGQKTKDDNTGRKVNRKATAAAFRFNPRNFSFHSRAFLKIQDGCDRNCAYCRVSLARGRSVSLEAEEILCRLKALEEAGLAEAVITGVNIAQYRNPENPAVGLPALLRFLLDNTERIALRLSSIEPDFCEPDFDSGTGFETKLQGRIFGGEFYELLSSSRIRGHFHLSVQSGSDKILAAMGRPYGARHIIKMVEDIRGVKDDPFLACDIITGFPGESDGDFEKTAELCRIADFAWIHAFPYSKRPGTRAAFIKGQVEQRIAGERLLELTRLARQGRERYVRRWKGKTVEAVAETDSGETNTGCPPPFFHALTENYIRVRVPFNKTFCRLLPGTSFRCRIGRGAEEGENAFDAWAEPEGALNSTEINFQPPACAGRW